MKPILTILAALLLAPLVALHAAEPVLRDDKLKSYVARFNADDHEPFSQAYLHLSAGHVVELAADGCSTAGPLQRVFDPWPIPPDWSIECVCLEGSKLFFRNGWYHLIVAQGGTAGPATSHMAIHARSKTPLGPWEYSAFNPIVHTWSREERWWSRGHATALEATDGSWWLVYHAYEKDYK